MVGPSFFSGGGDELSDNFDNGWDNEGSHAIRLPIEKPIESNSSNLEMGEYFRDKSEYVSNICNVGGLEIIMAGENIDNLTMEQYLTLTRGNQTPGVVKPEIGGNVNFEIKSQFMRELRKNTFADNKKDDAHEHVERILDIVSLFNILGVTHDAVTFRVFPITLIGAAKSNNSEGMAAIASKLDNLGRDMKKLKENVHVIQVGCQLYGGAHLDKECPLNEEVKSMEEVKY
ncbi:hypothetical protein Tco_0169321 [Tanacetum coccineum]